MTKFLHLTLLLCLAVCSCNAQRKEKTEEASSPALSKKERAGYASTCHAAAPSLLERAVGEAIDSCFTSQSISDSIFARMWKNSYKADCTVPRSELRYLKVLHYTIDGKIQVGELVCNKAIAKDLLEIFRSLYEAKYPIERMTLIDEYGANDEASMQANNTSCFNFRFVAGSKKLSNHSRGLAIDINPLYNPYVKQRKDGKLFVQPEAGRPYADRSKAFDYKITRNDLCYKLFKQHGFEWGGDWKYSKDYQHFEIRE